MTISKRKTNRKLLKEKCLGFHNVDAREISRHISQKLVNVIITSPPYADLKDYGTENQIGFGQTYEEYLNDLQKVFKSCYDISKDKSSLWIIIDTFKKKGKLVPLPFDLSDGLKKVGWILQDVIIWNKTKTLPYSRKGQLRNIFEYILFFSKTPNYKYYINRIKEPEGLKKWWVKYPERYNPKGKNPSNIWTFTIPTQGTWGNGKIKHHCPFPPKLIERILLLTTNKGDVVLDPFAGSGIVLAQAHCMERKYIGFEINENYIKSFHKEVLPEVTRRWKIRNKELKKNKYKQKQLEQKIEKLRKLKFTKLILQKVIEKYPDIDIKCALVLDNRQSNGIYKQSTEIVFGDKLDKKNVKEYVNTIMNKKPLSKFETETSINYIKLESLQKKTDIKNYLYLYPEGRFNYYSKIVSLNEIIKLYNSNYEEYNKLPPIISDISIRQKVPEDVNNEQLISIIDF